MKHLVPLMLTLLCASAFAARLPWPTPQPSQPSCPQSAPSGGGGGRCGGRPCIPDGGHRPGPHNGQPYGFAGTLSDAQQIRLAGCATCPDGHITCHDPNGVPDCSPPDACPDYGSDECRNSLVGQSCVDGKTQQAGTCQVLVPLTAYLGACGCKSD